MEEFSLGKGDLEKMLRRQMQTDHNELDLLYTYPFGRSVNGLQKSSNQREALDALDRDIRDREAELERARKHRAEWVAQCAALGHRLSECDHALSLLQRRWAPVVSVQLLDPPPADWTAFEAEEADAEENRRLLDEEG